MTERGISILWYLCLFVLCFVNEAYARNVQKGSSGFRVSMSGLEVPDYKKLVLRIEIDEFGSDYASRIDLKEGRVKEVCRSYLSHAGLEPTFKFIRPEYLDIQIKVSLHAFSILLQFTRPVIFEAEGTTYARYGAKTWQKIVTGTHGGGPEYILKCLQLLLEAFANEYVKANSIGRM